MDDAKIIAALKGTKWMTAAELAGPGASPQQVAAITKRLGAMTNDGLLFPSADGAYRLTTKATA